VNGRVRPNINGDDVNRFVDQIWHADAELQIWRELYPTWSAWYRDPRCPHDGCAICAEDWGI
jgi:hypothetical protein